MNQKVTYDKPSDEVLGVNALEEENVNELDEIQKLIEE